MTELRELLREAVDLPAERPDLDLIARAARGRRRRRRAGGAVTTLLAAAIVGSAIRVLPASTTPPDIVGSMDRADLSQDHPDPGPPGSELVGSLDAGEGADGAPARSTHPVGDGAHDVPTGSEDRSEEVAVTVPADLRSSPQPPDGATRSAEGCFVEQRATAPCTYTATQPAGYEADGNGGWTITIERDGQTILINGEIASTCGPTGTIRPGDRVTVYANRRVPPGELSYGGHRSVGAGTEYGLWCER